MQLKFKSEAIVGVYVKLEGVLGDEKGITELHLVNALFLVFDFLQHFLLLILDVIERCDC